jgi:arylsulfatase A-like enzyme
LYDAEISYLDDQLRPVISLLAEGGDDFVVIFTADHGEVMYGRPGFFDHAGLYDDTVRIPLVIAGSGVPQGRVVEGIYQHLDLAPTILSLFGQPVPTTMTGTDLIDVATNGPDAPGYEAIYLSEGTWEIKWGIRTREWKLVKVIDPGVHRKAEDELFDLTADPSESINVASAHPEVVDRLELALRRAWEGLLAGYPDPLREQTFRGVPAQEWLDRATRDERLEAQAR